MVQEMPHELEAENNTINTEVHTDRNFSNYLFFFYLPISIFSSRFFLDNSQRLRTYQFPFKAHERTHQICCTSSESNG